MTIEYKDSKRIVGLSSDVLNTPDINETFETDTKTAQNGTLVAWDSTDKRIEGTMSRIGTNTNWIYDLGSDLSTTKFIVDFQFDIISNTNPTGTSATNFFQITSATSSNQNAGGFSFTFESNGSGGYFGINAKNSGDMESGNTWGSSGAFASNTTYYMRMIRDGDDFTCIRYSDTWGGTVAETLEKTVSGVTGLRYWRIQNYNGATSSYNGVTTFAVDNLKLYNGVTSLTNKPTDVQDNSLLVEKDTARRYWFDADASYTTVEAGATTDSNGGAAYVTYKQITGLTAGDEISHVTFDVYSTPTDTSFKGGVYTDSGNNPTTLLASGELTNQNISNTYTTLSIPLTSNATVPSNGIVWVAIIPNKTNPLLRVSTSSSSYTNSKFSTTTGSYTNYSNWMLSTASVQGAGENNVRFGVKIYHAPAWTMQPTFRDDFSTDNWVGGDSKNIVSGGSLNFDMHRDGSNDSTTRDITSLSVSDSKWVLRFKMNFTVANTGGNSNRIYFGLSSGGNTVGQNSTQDAIMLYQKHDINDTIGACDADNAALPSPATTTVSYATGTDYYCEIARTSTTTYTVKMWTGSYGGTVFANESGTCNATLVGLNYIKISNHDTSNVSTWNTLTGTIDDIEFYNGVGSVN